MTATLISQIIVMFCLMGVGFVANRLKVLSDDAISGVTNLLLKVIGPALIIMALQRPLSASSLQTLWRVGLGVIVSYILMIVISHLTFRKSLGLDQRRSAIFSSIYNNVGFIGIPLVSAVFGLNGVFYAVISMVVYNLFCWTHGISLFHKDKRSFSDTLRSILLNPNIIAVIIGLICFIGSITLPKILSSTLTYIGNANTPLSMMVIGFSLANCKFHKNLLDWTVFVTVIYRNLVFPALAFVIFLLLRLKGVDLVGSLLIAACPAPSMAVLFTLEVKGNPDYSLIEMALSTVACLATIPFLFMVLNIG